MSHLCPSDTTLRDLFAGACNPDEIHSIEQHLNYCNRCPGRLEQFFPGTQLSELLKLTVSRVPAQSPESSNALTDLIDRLLDMVPGSRSQTAESQNHENDGSELPSFEPSIHADDLGRLANYRVRRLLGRGGMGFVFDAIDETLDRPVALKVLRPRSNRDPIARARFLREARAMASVRHDHIAVVYQVGEAASTQADEPGTAYLSMELLCGQSLRSWLAANPRPPVETVLRIAKEAASGLVAAHNRGLIHRDIKPGNLWLEAPPGWEDQLPDDQADLGSVGRLKLIDFGLAATSADHEPGHSVPGTPAYMAPELFTGSAATVGTDLFAVGCVLYEMCTAEHPFPGRKNRQVRYFDSPPPPARELNPAIPARLSMLISQLLASDPAQRPATAQDLVAQLNAVERSLSTSPLRAGRVLQIGSIIGGVISAAIILAMMGWYPPADDSSTVEADKQMEAGQLRSAASAPSNRSLFPNGPVDNWWFNRLAEHKPQEQFRIVAHKLAELNPGYDPSSASGWVEPELVIRFSVQSTHIVEISPIRGLRDLKNLTIAGPEVELPGKLVELRPIETLNLVIADFRNNPQLRDFTPLKRMQLQRLNVSGTAMDTLQPIASIKLAELDISNTLVRDLGPVADMPNLRTLRCRGCPIVDFSPIIGTSILRLEADVAPGQVDQLVRGMPLLQWLNNLPVSDPKR